MKIFHTLLFGALCAVFNTSVMAAQMKQDIASMKADIDNKMGSLTSGSKIGGKTGNSGIDAAISAVTGNKTEEGGSSAVSTVKKLAGEKLEKIPGLQNLGDNADLDKLKTELGDKLGENKEKLAAGIEDMIKSECGENDENCSQTTENTAKKIAASVSSSGENKKTQLSVDEAEKKYADAKENEQSLENRTLSSVTMAATGIGGMELAQGLSEQKSDKAAEDEMNAYLSTFQCKIGTSGKSYQGGETAIETPGANQLIKLYQEYVDLAASLKSRKNVLGMKPGLEAEVVLDKAHTGLYDDVGHGIENGTFASLYRASKGNENDIKKLEDAKAASKKRVVGGAVAAGAGVVGGIVGNAIINKNKDTVQGIINKVTGKDVNSEKTEDVVPEEEVVDEMSDADKVKECVDQLQEKAFVYEVAESDGKSCYRVFLKIADDYSRVLTDDEAAAISPVWKWGCQNNFDDLKLYTDGTQEHEKDACQTVANIDSFVAEHSKECSSYSGYKLTEYGWCMPDGWSDGAVDTTAAKLCTDAGGVYGDNKCVCNGEYKQYDEVTNLCKVVNPDKKRHTPCTEEDYRASQHTNNTIDSWYDYKKYCVARTCADGYELARNKKGESNGYCKKK